MSTQHRRRQAKPLQFTIRLETKAYALDAAYIAVARTTERRQARRVGIAIVTHGPRSSIREVGGMVLDVL